ncbi:MAG: 50S ribosomal protein L10 [Nanoarchaeota archaeon]
MKHVSKKKIEEVKKLIELMKQYKVIGIIDLTSLPSPNLQAIKNKLMNKIEIKVVKKSLIKIAIDESKERDLSSLKRFLENSIPAILLSNEDPFRLFKLIKENKTNAPAKPGQLAPFDLTIPAGPTQFTPGPIIGELGAIGLQTSVEAGKIVIKKDKLVVKQGEVIKPEVASILAKLSIEPIEISVNVLAIYDNNVLYEKIVLDVNQEDYINNIKLAYNQAVKLAEEIGYVSKDNVEMLLIKAYRDAFLLSKELKIETSTEVEKSEAIREVKTEVKQEIKEVKEEKRENGGFVGYNKNAEEKAQNILKELQDKKIQEAKEQKPKQKSMWD